MIGRFEKISVIGLGYVGLPTAATLAARGVKVHGVDIRPEVVERINSGKTHIIEPDLDIIVHSVAFAPREQLAGGYLDSVTREGFQIAHDVSSYSLAALAKAGRALMEGRNGAILTLTYLGAVRSIPSYNVMGLAKASLEANVRFLAADLGPRGTRVNAISAGPIKTLAAAGVGGFRKMLTHVAAATPLRRNVTIEEVGNVAAFLCSDLASGITGEIVYVDAGYSHVGMSFEESRA